MKKVVLSIASLLAVIVLFPLLSPLLGFASHRQALSPPGQAIVLANGTSLNSYAYGSGERLAILVHGVPGSAAMMRPLAQSLAARGLRVVTYDRLGWAHSGARPKNSLANPTSNARDLLALSEALAAENPVYIGYSYGGGVVQEANRLAPDLPACNILLSSIGPGARRPSTSPSVVSSIVFSRPMLRWALAVTPVAMRVSAPNMRALYFPEQPSSTEEVHEFIAALELSVDIWRRELDERFIEFDEFYPELIERPTLIIHGVDDRTVPSRVAEGIHSAAPVSELVLQEETGHAMVLTQHEMLADSIVDFIDRCGSLTND